MFVACINWKYFRRKWKAKGFRDSDLKENFNFQLTSDDMKVIKNLRFQNWDFKTDEISEPGKFHISLMKLLYCKN